jgi:hypothetical protein
LYHPSGESISLSPGLWRRVLERARASGWQPAGALPAPVPLDGSPPVWDGGYETPAGQQVSRADAAALGAALERSLAGQPDAAPAFRELARFCKAGGFLVCPSPGIADSLLSLAEHLGVTATTATAPRSEQPVPVPRKGADSPAT